MGKKGSARRTNPGAVGRVLSGWYPLRPATARITRATEKLCKTTKDDFNDSHCVSSGSPLAAGKGTDVGHDDETRLQTVGGA